MISPIGQFKVKVKVTNYFIVSLATSDVMVALLVMPLSIYSEV